MMWWQPDLDLVAGEPAEAVAAAQVAVDASKGIGTITSYATEVALPVKGTWKNPAIGSARADVVLIAAKFDNYARFFRRKEEDTDGIEICVQWNDSEIEFLVRLARS